MVLVVNYLFITEKEGLSPVEIKKCCTESTLNVDDQLNSLLDLIFPSNIYSFPHKEHSTIIPLYLNTDNHALMPIRDLAGIDNVKLKPCYLFTKSISIGNKVISVSIVTTLSIFQVLSPLLTYLLQELKDFRYDLKSIEVVYENLNNSKLDLLMAQFEHLNRASRFAITRLQPDFSSNESLSLPDNLQREFRDHGNFYKTTIDVREDSIFEFPIQVAKSAIISSPLSMFGIDLQRSSHIKELLKLLKETKVKSSNLNPIVPYQDIKPIHVFFNSLLLHKRIAIFSNRKLYNELGNFVQTLYLIFNAVFSTSTLLFYPNIDYEHMDMVKGEKSVLIGTSDFRLISEFEFDVIFNMDDDQILVKSSNTSNLISFVDEETPDDFVPFKTNNKEKLANWQISCFPKIIKDKDYPDAFLLSEYYNVEEKFTFPIKKSCTPKIDLILDDQLNQLIDNHHDDLTLFVTITNYLRELSSKVLPAFYHFITVSQLKDHRQNLVADNLAITRDDLEHQLINYLQVNHIIQPFPLNYPFDSKTSFLEDSDIFNYYLELVDSNTALLELAIMFNSNTFTHSNTIPGFLFSWETTQGTVDIRLDTHYLSRILDKLIDETSNETWSLNKHSLLQLFKVVNSILKTHGTGVDGFTDVLMDFFIDNNGEKSDIKPDLKFGDTNYLNIDTLDKIGKLGKKRFGKLVMIASLYISTNGAQDLVQTKKGLRRRDLLMVEFKRFLSTILNDSFFKEYVFAELDDYVKLMVNDFIDYHM